MHEKVAEICFLPQVKETFHPTFFNLQFRRFLQPLAMWFFKLYVHYENKNNSIPPTQTSPINVRPASHITKTDQFKPSLLKNGNIINSSCLLQNNVFIARKSESAGLEF